MLIIKLVCWLICWLVYGLIVGCVAKWLHHKLRGADGEPVGALATIEVGVAGSFIGGFLNYLLFGTGSPFSSSGVLMGVVGAVILLCIYGVSKKRAT